MNSPQTASSQKQLLWIILVGLALIIIASAVYYFAYQTKSETATTVVTPPKLSIIAANLALVEGSVSIMRPNQDNYVEAKEGDTVRANYKVKTMEDSRAIVAFDTGDIIRLDGAAEVQINTISSKAVTINVLSGHVYSRVDHSNTKIYTILAGSAQAVATGTAFDSSLLNNTAEFWVTDGSIRLDSGSSQTAVDTNKKATVNLNEPNSVQVNDLTATELASEFLEWNKLRDAEPIKNTANTSTTKKVETAIPQSTSPAYSGTNLVLSGRQVEAGAAFEWKISNSLVSDGFLLIKGPSGSQPSFPGNDNVMIKKEARSYIWSLADGQTYSFRVCLYDAGKCKQYSNVVTVQVNKKNSAEAVSNVSSITLSGQANGTKIDLSWQTAGNASNGFKVIRSLSSGPTYPTRSGDAATLVSGGVSAHTLSEGLQSGKTYYIRICEYVASRCGTYSNEVTVSLP